MAGELYEGIDEVEWRTLRSCGIAKEVDGGGIRNGEGGGKFWTGDRVLKTEVEMEASASIKAFFKKN